MFERSFGSQVPPVKISTLIYKIIHEKQLITIDLSIFIAATGSGWAGRTCAVLSSDVPAAVVRAGFERRFCGTLAEKCNDLSPHNGKAEARQNEPPLHAPPELEWTEQRFDGANHENTKMNLSRNGKQKRPLLRPLEFRSYPITSRTASSARS